MAGKWRTCSSGLHLGTPKFILLLYVVFKQFSSSQGGFLRINLFPSIIDAVNNLEVSDLDSKQRQSEVNLDTENTRIAPLEKQLD